MKLDVTIKGIADVQRVLAMIAPREAKNLIKATVRDIAKQMSDDARARAPGPKTGTLDKSIRPQALRGTGEKIEAAVTVTGKKANAKHPAGYTYYWRILEFGDGPDKIDHAFMAKALWAMRQNLDAIYLETFTRKLEARLARERKRMAK